MDSPKVEIELKRVVDGKVTIETRIIHPDGMTTMTKTLTPEDPIMEILDEELYADA